MSEATKADIAVAHILRQMREDGRLAYFLGYATRSFELLTEAYAHRNNMDVEQFRKDFDASLRYEEPTCKYGGCRIGTKE